VFQVISEWWSAHDAKLQARRAELSAQALAAPEDLELQAEIAEELGRLLDCYKGYLLPFFVSVWLRRLRGPRERKPCWGEAARGCPLACRPRGWCA
jgi:hypothetical protein